MREKIIVEEVKVKPYLVSFCGLERCDILYFLARSLELYAINKEYKNVLIIDNSDTKDLYNGIYKDEVDVIQRNRITVLKDIKYSEDFFKAFHYILVYHGMDIDNEYLEKSDRIVLTTDYNKLNIEKLSKKYNSEKNIFIIFRDKAIKSLPEKRILKMLNIKEAQLDAMAILPYDIKDYRNYLTFTLNGTAKFNKKISSPAYYDMIRYLLEEITGMNLKMSKKIVGAIK